MKSKFKYGIVSLDTYMPKSVVEIPLNFSSNLMEKSMTLFEQFSFNSYLEDELSMAASVFHQISQKFHISEENFGKLTFVSSTKNNEMKQYGDFFSKQFSLSPHICSFQPNLIQAFQDTLAWATSNETSYSVIILSKDNLKNLGMLQEERLNDSGALAILMGPNALVEVKISAKDSNKRINRIEKKFSSFITSKTFSTENSELSNLFVTNNKNKTMLKEEIQSMLINSFKIVNEKEEKLTSIQNLLYPVLWLYGIGEKTTSKLLIFLIINSFSDRNITEFELKKNN